MSENNNSLLTEKHFFLDGRQKPLYCVEYLPGTARQRDLCVILCKPIWGERIRTHRIFTNLARTLCREGVPVITCDHFGDGNSGGDTLDLSYDGMVDDIERLHHYCLEMKMAHEFALVGLRMGATCAIGAEKKINHLNKMILVEPILNAVDYLRDSLRSHLTNQMSVHKKIIKNRETLIQEIKNGTPVNMDGFLLCRYLWESFERISPVNAQSTFAGPVFVLSLGNKGSKTQGLYTLSKMYANGHFETVEKEFVWHDWRKNVPRPPLFINKISQLLATQPD